MNELITINHNNEQFPISARELYEKLEFHPAHWAEWAKNNILNNQFAIKDSDYEFFTPSVKNDRGRPSQDYNLTIDFAKRLCMMAKTEKGEQIRRYFIEVEKRFKQQLISADSQTVQMIVQAVAQPLLQSINDLKRNQQALNNLVSYLAHQVINPETKTSANLNDTKSALNQPYRGKYDQETLDIAFLREEACQAIIAARNDRFIFKKDLGMIERAWAEQLGLNPKYLFKLVKQYETEGFSALLPKERRDKGGRRSICLAGSALIKDLHCAEPNPVVMATYTKALQEAQELGPEFCNHCGFAENCQQTDRAGIKIGSHNTVYRLINVELPAEEIDQWRSGLEKYRRKSQASKRF